MSTIECVATAPQRERERLARQALARRFGHPRPAAAHNLLVIRGDLFDSGETDRALHRIAALSAALDERPLRPAEPFAPCETRILWIEADETFYLTRQGTQRGSAPDAELTGTAALAAQHVFPGLAAPAARPAPVEPIDVAAHEAQWMADLPVLIEILAEVIGIESVRSPQIEAAVDKVLAGLGALEDDDQTPREAWLAMVELHCRTNAYSNDFIRMLARLHNPPRPIFGSGGLLGDLDAAGIDEVTRSLDERGFHVFESRLSDDVCERLLRHSLEQESLLVGDDRAAGVERARYDRRKPLVEKYVLQEAEALRSPDVQRIISDPSILGLTQAYLGTSPVLDLLVMWWNTTFADRPSDQAAMLYHFDMHRVSFLKWFFYLTDVTSETGPHCLIAGSHRRAGKPAELLERGFVRIPDEEIRAHYAPEQRVELCGPRGTIIAVDTRAFHKGKLPVAGDRLVLQFQLSSGLFGAPYRRVALDAEAATPLRRTGESIYRLFLAGLS